MPFVENCFILKFPKIISSSNISVSSAATSQHKGTALPSEKRTASRVRSDAASRKTRLRCKQRIQKEKNLCPLKLRLWWRLLSCWQAAGWQQHRATLTRTEKIKLRETPLRTAEIRFREIPCTT